MPRFIVPVIVTCLALAACGGTVQQQVTALDSGVFQYNSQLAGFNLRPGEALDFMFSPSVYASLSNAASPSGFTGFPLQPNNPPGAHGGLVVEEQSTGPVSDSAGPVAIDVTLSNLGTVAHNLFNVGNTRAFGSVLQSVTTIQAGTLVATSEPGNFV